MQVSPGCRYPFGKVFELCYNRSGSYCVEAYLSVVRRTMKITCVVDDRAQPGAGLQAEHGASFLIEVEGRQVLFDSGPSDSVLLHNLAALGYKAQQLDALVLSHGHDDHTGGVAVLLEQVPGLRLYAHPDLFRERFRKTDTGPRRVGPAIDEAAAAEGATLRLSRTPVEVVPGLWITGEIAPRPEPEGRGPHLVVREGDGWVADPYLDDISVVIEGTDGLVLVCGCCHAGLLNTLACVRTEFGQDPVAVVGGIHLMSADGPTMDHVVEGLRTYGPPQMWLGHCTGQRAYLALKVAFGDRVLPCLGGMVLTL
jgi:7,8-dihydropterin-6-yl-methyl-4-(beta-D-ribofuranosyl)aminobenzene 5'-phosphate synthase